MTDLQHALTVGTVVPVDPTAYVPGTDEEWREFMAQQEEEAEWAEWAESERAAHALGYC